MKLGRKLEKVGLALSMAFFGLGGAFLLLVAPFVGFDATFRGEEIRCGAVLSEAWPEVKPKYSDSDIIYDLYTRTDEMATVYRLRYERYVRAQACGDPARSQVIRGTLAGAFSALFAFGSYLALREEEEEEEEEEEGSGEAAPAS